MKFFQQPKRLKIENKDPDVKKKRIPRHSDLLPDTIRCIVCGPSNCGKTNVVLCLLLEKNGLKFENVYLYSKTPFQPKYEQLRLIFDQIPDLGYHVFGENVEIVKARDAKKNSIFIFDDVACDKHDVMREYFSMGRHSGVDCFYLGQTYSRIPKQLIRDNSNLLVIFKQDDTNLRHVYDDHITTDMSFNTFKTMCSLCWENKYGFLVVDKDSELETGRYRKGFDVYIKP